MRELLETLMEDDIFKPASAEEHGARKAAGWRALAQKYAPGTKVLYYQGVSGVAIGPNWAPVPQEHKHLAGIVKKVRMDFEEFTMDVFFPKTGLTFPLQPSQVEIVNPDAWKAVAEAVTEDIFKPASAEELARRQIAGQVKVRAQIYTPCQPNAVNRSGYRWFGEIRAVHGNQLSVYTGTKELTSVNRKDLLWLDRLPPDAHDPPAFGLVYTPQITEAEDPFQPASADELSKRQEEGEAAQRKAMYARAEKVLPGSIAALKKHYKDDALVDAAIAYGDSQEVEDVLKGLKPAVPTLRNNPLAAAGTMEMRDLDWPGVWTNGLTFVKQAKIVGEYNAFGPEVAEQLFADFEFKQFRLARENSVAVYIRPVTDDEVRELGRERPEIHGNFAPDYGHDELATTDGELRIWWD